MTPTPLPPDDKREHLATILDALNVWSRYAIVEEEHVAIREAREALRLGFDTYTEGDDG